MPSLDCAETPATQPKRRRKQAALTPPEVATWITLDLNCRSKRNQLIAATPCIVSKVDLASETMNVLWPNAISLCLHRITDKQHPLLFAIETYPLSLARPYGKTTVHLQEVLTKALLHFVEKRGRGFCNQQGLAVAPTPPPAFVEVHSWTGNQVGGAQDETDRLRLGVRALQDRCLVNDRPREEEVQDAVAPKTPPRAARPAEALRDFTKAISKLFRDDILAMAAVAGLATEFPEWKSHVQELENQNKIMVADDLVILI